MNPISPAPKGRPWPLLHPALPCSPICPAGWTWDLLAPPQSGCRAPRSLQSQAGLLAPEEPGQAFPSVCCFHTLVSPGPVGSTAGASPHSAVVDAEAIAGTQLRAQRSLVPSLGCWALAQATVQVRGIIIIGFQTSQVQGRAVALLQAQSHSQDGPAPLPHCLRPPAHPCGPPAHWGPGQGHNKRAGSEGGAEAPPGRGLPAHPRASGMQGQSPLESAGPGSNSHCNVSAVRAEPGSGPLLSMLRTAGQAAQVPIQAQLCM